MWDDRKITAGLNWDSTIKEKVRNCDLFIALTSANFNASGYIEGVEMSAAWKRHNQGGCRIVPVMWRAWRPPAGLRSLQFLPSLDRDVVNSLNKDEELKTLTVNIEKLVNEMAVGGWKPSAPTVDRLFAELPYLCNWTKPITDLQDLRNGAHGIRRPRVLALIGTEDDCADAFLRRAHRAGLRRALDLDPSVPVHDIQIMDWPHDSGSVRDCLNYVLESHPDTPVEQKLRPRFDDHKDRC